MRFAVISDIHGNLAALEAVLGDIDALEDPVERIVCAGDVVGLGHEPNAVVELLQSREITAVRGNYDDAVAFDRLSSGVDFANIEEEQADYRAVEWTRRQLSTANMEYLRQMPKDIRLFPIFRGTGVKRDELERAQRSQGRDMLIRMAFGNIGRSAPRRIKKVLVVHGSPRAFNENIRSDSANSILATIAKAADADLLISGHSGEAFEHKATGMTFVGPGAVSGPHALAGHSAYAVVTVTSDLVVEFRRTTYGAQPSLKTMTDPGPSAD
ncbi:MAG TPA: metallophosphoesterase family protein [Chloroflexota bacterium]